LCNLIVIALWFEKINEKRIKRNINNDLTVVASQIPGGAIHDRNSIKFFLTPHLGLAISLHDLHLTT